ncbi:hypothetical protein GALL_418550 [mine drainage metagenome]|uniref:Uncharacterized protein n=1 Tax=mine drainage metagenome TaxID=410659 RepID=A0A1J5PYA5_9ZZZZ
MFVIGGVVDAGGHQRHRRLGRRAERRHRSQRRQQFVRISFHRRDAVAGEQVRKQPHHDFAVFQHVGNTRWRARIVLQHDEVFRGDPDDVDAGDVDVDVVRHILAIHLRTEHRVLEDEVFGDDVGAQDVAAVVDVAQEHVEREHPLLETFFEDGPFFRRQDPGDHVERDQPLLGFGIAIDRKGNADPAEQQLRLLAAIFEGVRRRLLQPAGELLVGRANVAAEAVHFIERNCHKSRPPLEATPQCMTSRDGSKARASGICIGPEHLLGMTGVLHEKTAGNCLFRMQNPPNLNVLPAGVRRRVFQLGVIRPCG